MPEQFLRNATNMRCPKCYRLHDLEYLMMDNRLCLGLRCHSHKKPDHYYIYTFPAQYNLRIPQFNVYGELREVKNRVFEVRPMKEFGNQTIIQEKIEW